MLHGAGRNVGKEIIGDSFNKIWYFKYTFKIGVFMKITYPPRFGFCASILSVFDIGGTIQEKSITPLSKGLEFDMQQLSNDQNALKTDYQKAYDQLVNEILGENRE